jgi:hypothetical protein
MGTYRYPTMASALRECARLHREQLAECKRAGRQDGLTTFRSRGKELLAIDAQGERLGEPLFGWKGTIKEVEEFIADHSPKVAKVAVQCGIDAAESVFAFNNGHDYAPWYGYWTIDLWEVV